MPVKYYKKQLVGARLRHLLGSLKIQVWAGTEAAANACLLRNNLSGFLCMLFYELDRHLHLAKC